MKIWVFIFIIINLIIICTSAYEFTIPIDKSLNNKNSGKLGVSEGDSSGGISERIESNMVDPIIIKKYILPAKNNGYIAGDRARIFVEIKNNKKIPHLEIFHLFA